MSIKKGTPPPRYDEAFKAGAVKTVTEQARPIKDVAADLGICIDILRSWLKASSSEPSSVEHRNRDNRRQRKLEAENKKLPPELSVQTGVFTLSNSMRIKISIKPVSTTDL